MERQDELQHTLDKQIDRDGKRQRCEAGYRVRQDVEADRAIGDAEQNFPDNGAGPATAPGERQMQRRTENQQPSDDGGQGDARNHRETDRQNTGHYHQHAEHD